MALYTWTQRSFVALSWQGIAASSDGAKVVACAFNDRIYTSSDHGVSWTPRESVRNWQGVASSADGVKLVAVVAAGRIYTSTDSGVSWTPRDSNRNWNGVASSADGTKLVAVDYQYGQIYTSTDSGVTWTPRDSARLWYKVASSADGVKLVAVTWQDRIYTSTDSGVTWTPRDSVRSWVDVASSADGTRLITAASGAGVERIYISTDSGVTWTPTGPVSSGVWVGVASNADGSILLASCSGSTYISLDYGATWNNELISYDGGYYAMSASGSEIFKASVYLFNAERITLYVDFDLASGGDGSSGNPYGVADFKTQYPIQTSKWKAVGSWNEPAYDIVSTIPLEIESWNSAVPARMNLHNIDLWGVMGTLENQFILRSCICYCNYLYTPKMSFYDSIVKSTSVLPKLHYVLPATIGYYNSTVLFTYLNWYAGGSGTYGSLWTIYNTAFKVGGGIEIESIDASSIVKNSALTNGPFPTYINSQIGWVPPTWPAWNAAKESFAQSLLATDIDTPPEPGDPITLSPVGLWGETRTGIGGFYFDSAIIIPVADFTADNTHVVIGQTVNFTDLSLNTPTSWLYNFGDSTTSTLQNPSHAYGSAGLFTVVLTATNIAGSDTSTKTNYISVTSAVITPVADFTADNTHVVIGQTVNFTDLSLNTPTSWLYNFGDSITSILQNPSHAYGSSGLFTVVLTATNTAGSDSSTKANYILVDPIIPIANFSGSPINAVVGQTITFIDLSLNTPTSWLWSFGDGRISTVQNPTHAYGANGLYTVTLEVSNSSGSDTIIFPDYIRIHPMRTLARYGRGYASKLRVIAPSFSNTQNDTPYVLQTDRKPIIFYNEGPVIITQPASQTLPIGSDATFSVTATGTAPLSYQWKHGLSDISGATSNIYVANGFDGTKTTYMVVVSNIAGAVGSIPAVLKVS